MIRSFTLSLLLLITSWASTQAKQAPDFYEPYAALLSQHVRLSYKDGITTTLVDYKGWSQDSNYKEARVRLMLSDPSKLSTHQEKLAYWINVYNFLTIDLIIREEETESIKKLGSLLQNTWKRYDWDISGKDYTLHDIEHNILRKMNEPRIHMALVCASLSCPNLRTEPYSPEILEAQLTDQSKRFLSNKYKGLRINEDYILISSIFKWFADDFGGEEGIIRFINRYAVDLSLVNPRIKYMGYNWDLNSQ